MSASGGNKETEQYQGNLLLFLFFFFLFCFFGLIFEKEIYLHYQITIIGDYW